MSEALLKHLAFGSGLRLFSISDYQINIEYCNKQHPLEVSIKITSTGCGSTSVALHADFIERDAYFFPHPYDRKNYMNLPKEIRNFFLNKFEGIILF